MPFGINLPGPFMYIAKGRQNKTPIGGLTNKDLYDRHQEKKFLRALDAMTPEDRSRTLAELAELKQVSAMAFEKRKKEIVKSWKDSR